MNYLIGDVNKMIIKAHHNRWAFLLTASFSATVKFLTSFFENNPFALAKNQNKFRRFVRQKQIKNYRNDIN